jgi:hypothetical protein
MTRLAYVIGNNDYMYWNKLINPVNDANGVAGVLASVGFKVRLFLNLNYKEMSQCMNDFGHELNDHNVGLFYYAGHGIEMRNESYLIPIDTSIKSQEDIILSSIKLSTIFQWMASYRDNTNMIFLDACRTKLTLMDNSDTLRTGLIPIDGPLGTYISFSTSSGSEAGDGNGDNSLFAQALMRFIPSEGEKIEDIFKKVRYYVEKESNGRQLPVNYSTLIGDFYFVESRHNFSVEGVTPQIIYDYAESIWDDVEKQYDVDTAEALVFINVSNHFNITLLEVFRGYSIIQNKNYFHFSDAELCALGLERFKAIGFTEKNNRWYYDGNAIRMGEILPLPSDLESLAPENGQEIDAKINVEYFFNDEKLIFHGTSNLPSGTLLMLSLRCAENRYFSQDKVSVGIGEFFSNGFTAKGERIPNGSYLLNITSPIFNVQPEEAKTFLGNRCRNLTGKIVEFNVIGGNTVNFVTDIVVDDR